MEPFRRAFGRLSPVVLGVVGLGSLAVPVYNVYTRVVRGGAPLLSTLVENAIPAVCALALIATAWWIVAGSWRRGEESTVVFWCLAAFVAAAALHVWLFGVQLVVDHRVRPYATAANAIIAASVLGLLVGVYDARRGRQHERVATERKNLSSLFENTTDCVVHIDFGERGPVAKAANDAFEDTFGYAEADVVGRVLTDLIVPETEGRTRIPDFERRVRNGESFETEVSRESVDGTREFLVRLIPLEADGEAYAVYTDITDRKRLHEEVADRNRVEYLHRVVSDLTDVDDTDAVGDVVMNAAAETLSHDVGCFVVDGEVVETRGDVDDVLAPDALDAAHTGGTATVTSHDGMAVLTIPVADRGAIQLGAPDGAFDDRDRDIAGLLGTHAGETLSRLDRQREIRAERERLEFVNRMLRHTLLNGMNVVRGRLNLLDDHVAGELDDHLDTASERVAEMISHVETMRSFTKGVVADGADRRPMPLGAVLKREVERVRDEYPDADVTVEGDLPNVDVAADDLLDEVIANVLTNAIQHNDTASPTVTVTTAVEEATACVAVHDDGPGIPDAEKTRVVEKGMQGLANPGDGFGLYFVNEVIERYGGDIDVRDNDPRGAVFELTFARADA
ncbi:sensor histidine kinase [Halarchaeum salinum]|uniref:histidine kinase n=1 Tax=Halarchaeum salinum TaxID=489912 RepID=A0AAV3S690_9EURY